MVYTYDIYGHFNDDNKNDKLKKLLKKMNVTPMPATKSAIDSDKREETKNDDLGGLFDSNDLIFIFSIIMFFFLFPFGQFKWIENFINHY